MVEHKQQVLLEEKRKRAMDLHLDYIVDQTTKYSKWLVKGLASATSSAEPSLQSAASSSLNGVCREGDSSVVFLESRSMSSWGDTCTCTCTHSTQCTSVVQGYNNVSMHNQFDSFTFGASIQYWQGKFFCVGKYIWGAAQGFVRQCRRFH